VGRQYPGSIGQSLSWFASDTDCLDYLEWLRWPGGFVCPRCEHAGGRRLGDGRFECAGCARRTSVTAGTIFDRTRTPLTVWLDVCWMFATSKDGVSAQSVHRSLEIGSYQTAWAMLHRVRSVLVRPDRDRLAGPVEVDETFIGGVEPGPAGGRARGKKELVVIAVEVLGPRGLGRCRMGVVPDACGSARTLPLSPAPSAEPQAEVRALTAGDSCTSKAKLLASKENQGWSQSVSASVARVRACSSISAGVLNPSVCRGLLLRPPPLETARDGIEAEGFKQFNPPVGCTAGIHWRHPISACPVC
jgi:hypothetical protein